MADAVVAVEHRHREQDRPASSRSRRTRPRSPASAAAASPRGRPSRRRAPRSTLAKRLESSCSSPHCTVADRPVEVLVDHRELVGRVLVADVLGDVVALGHAPLVGGDGLLVGRDRVLTAPPIRPGRERIGAAKLVRTRIWGACAPSSQYTTAPSRPTAERGLAGRRPGELVATVRRPVGPSRSTTAAGARSRVRRQLAPLAAWRRRATTREPGARVADVPVGPTERPARPRRASCSRGTPTSRPPAPATTSRVVVHHQARTRARLALADRPRQRPRARRIADGDSSTAVRDLRTRAPVHAGPPRRPALARRHRSLSLTLRPSV